MRVTVLILCLVASVACRVPGTSEIKEQQTSVPGVPGAQGPAGSAGAAGATGSTGAAGVSAKRYRLLRDNGQIVSENVISFYSTFNDSTTNWEQFVSVFDESSGVTATYNRGGTLIQPRGVLYYQSTDCTGQPYLESHGAPQGIPIYIQFKNAYYYATGPEVSFAHGSNIQNGGCNLNGSGGFVTLPVAIQFTGLPMSIGQRWKVIEAAQ